MLPKVLVLATQKRNEAHAFFRTLSYIQMFRETTLDDDGGESKRFRWDWMLEPRSVPDPQVHFILTAPFGQFRERRLIAQITPFFSDHRDAEKQRHVNCIIFDAGAKDTITRELQEGLPGFLVQRRVFDASQSGTPTIQAPERSDDHHGFFDSLSFV
jgi:hypothetical protein